MRILTLLSFFYFLSPALGDIQFEDVSHQSGITRIGESWGNAWGDFDGDGYLDLWATNHKHKPSLYRNNGDGTFTDIIDEIWDTNPYADTHGVAWADFDNDGDQDLIVLSGSGGGRSNNTNPKQKNHFYINEAGRLLDRAAEANIDLPLLRGRTPLWFDSNGDGNLDLLLTGVLREDGDGNLVTSFLFQQIGMKTFMDTGFQAGFNFQKSAAFAQLSDITGDGNMDLIVASGPYPGAVFQVSATGQFKEITDSSGFPTYPSVQDATFADFNGDLLPDVILARDVYRSYINTIDDNLLKLYIRNNQGEKGMRFSADSDIYFEIYSVWEPRLSLVSIGENGHDIQQFDGEFVGADPERNVASFKFQLSPEDPRVLGLKPRPEFDLFGIYIGYDPDTKQWTLLYHKSSHTNNWTGFEAVISAQTPISNVQPIDFDLSELFYNPQSVILARNSELSNSKNQKQFQSISLSSDGRSVAAGDFDNDMDIDIYLVRSSSAGNLPNQLYENRGDGTFTHLVGIGEAEGSKQGRGQSVTMADYDRDGYLDLFLTNGRGAYPFNQGPDQLLRNIGGGNNWLQIDLEGTVSNRDGIGARVFATTPDGKTQLRENSGGIHWCQQDQKRIHFGLAQNQKVSELAIRWPSGIVQKLTDVPVNQVLRVVEKAVQTSLPGDVNQDGLVDILDFLVIVVHFGESPPTNPQVDTNNDGQVNLEDLVRIIEIIEENQNGAAAPTQNAISNRISTLSDANIHLLYTFYQNIEGMPGNATQIERVRRFLNQLLMPVDGPLKTRLHVNYPNPFNPETWIPYQLAEDTEITIRIYSTTGKIVRTLFSGHQASGYYLSRDQAAYWDGRNEFGEQVASGIYIYELATPTFKQTKRLVVVK